MKSFSSIRRFCAIALIMAVGSYGISGPALADIVPTSALLADQQLEASRGQVSELLQREDVATMLVDMGVDVDAALERVDSLTESELQTLAQQMDSLPAGQSALGTIALLLVVLILLDVAGVTDIFPGV